MVQHEADEYFSSCCALQYHFLPDGGARAAVVAADVTRSRLKRESFLQTLEDRRRHEGEPLLEEMKTKTAERKKEKRSRIWSLMDWRRRRARRCGSAWCRPDCPPASVWWTWCQTGWRLPQSADRREWRRSLTAEHASNVWKEEKEATESQSNHRRRPTSCGLYGGSTRLFSSSSQLMCLKNGCFCKETGKKPGKVNDAVTLRSTFKSTFPLFVKTRCWKFRNTETASRIHTAKSDS